MACQKQNPRTDLRLQKFLALCGAGSRRACERLIEEGRVTVDGQPVACQGVKINPRLQTVKIDGRRVVPEPQITLLFNKPRDVICTSSDPSGRRTFLSCLPTLPARVFTVGRLDRDSEGLLIITSDGDLAQAVSHPRNMVEKIYLVTLNRVLAINEQKHLMAGVESEGDLLRILAIRPTKGGGNRHVYEITISEGKNRHIRRMFSGLKLDILALQRIAVGPLRLGNLCPGQWRYLTEGERDKLGRYIAARARQPGDKKIELNRVL